MVDYEILYDREGCIGAAACVSVAPDVWEMADDGKANIKMQFINEDVLDINKAAASACPVTVIHIVNKETREQII